jgi:hypothetical protein
MEFYDFIFTNYFINLAKCVLTFINILIYPATNIC